MATRGTGASPANLTKNLKGIDFPADKQDILKHAHQLHAEKVVIDEIQKMPDREYNSMADVMKNFEPEYSESKTRQGQGQSQSRSQSQQRSSGQSGQGKSSHGGRSSSHH
ncbi:MAG TPA: DUF2795 domain-containing protein [Geomonas sp.]|nr:DUF2795 domain-containing protein [Geomonas sp.]